MTSKVTGGEQEKDENVRKDNEASVESTCKNI